jgi:hypothetical protein
MRRTTIGGRWHIPGRRYAGGGRRNPWINAMCNALHPGSETGSSSTAPVDVCSATERTPTDQPGPDDRQQKAAVRIWENEGGSLGTHPDRTLSY